MTTTKQELASATASEQLAPSFTGAARREPARPPARGAQFI